MSEVWIVKISAIDLDYSRREGTRAMLMAGPTAIFTASFGGWYDNEEAQAFINEVLEISEAYLTDSRNHHSIIKRAADFFENYSDSLGLSRWLGEQRLVFARSILQDMDSDMSSTSYRLFSPK